MLIEMEIKESSKEEIRKVALNLAKELKDFRSDVQTCGLLHDLLMGCGLTSEEIEKAAHPEKGATFDSHKFWESKRRKLNEIHTELLEKPDCEKLGLCFSFGSVLNAYREGDISFDRAIEVLEEIQNTTVQSIVDKLTEAFK